MEARSHIRKLMNNPSAEDAIEICSFFHNHNKIEILNQATINDIKDYLEAKKPDDWNALDLRIFIWLLRALKCICNPEMVPAVAEIILMSEECLPGVLNHKITEIDESYSKHFISLTQADRINFVRLGIKDMGVAKAWSRCPQFIKILCDAVAAEISMRLGENQLQDEFRYRKKSSLARIVFMDKNLSGRMYVDSKVMRTCLGYRNPEIGYKLVREVAEIEINSWNMSKMIMLTDPSFADYAIAMQTMGSSWKLNDILDLLDNINTSPECDEVLKLLLDHGLYSNRLVFCYGNSFTVAQQRRRIERGTICLDEVSSDSIQKSREHQLAEEKLKHRRPSCAFSLIDEHSEF